MRFSSRSHSEMAPKAMVKNRKQPNKNQENKGKNTNCCGWPMNRQNPSWLPCILKILATAMVDQSFCLQLAFVQDSLALHLPRKAHDPDLDGLASHQFLQPCSVPPSIFKFDCPVTSQLPPRWEPLWCWAWFGVLTPVLVVLCTSREFDSNGIKRLTGPTLEVAGAELAFVV